MQAIKPYTKHGPYTIANSQPSQQAPRKRFVLPPELLTLVFLECDINTLLNCRLICRDFDAIVRNQQALLYKLALALECQTDWPSHAGVSLSSFQKLQRLYRQSLAWRGELPPALKVHIPVLPRGSINYELQGGIFTLTNSMGEEGHGVAFPSLSPPETMPGGKRVDFIKLPSAISGDLSIHTGCISLGDIKEVIESTISVEMDLLVLVEGLDETFADGDRLRYRVHLLSLSRSDVIPTPHPLAHSAVLKCEGLPDVWNYTIHLRLCGDHIGILLGQTRTPAGDKLTVWNWKTGQWAAKQADNEGLESFIFLQEGLVLMPSFITKSLDIYGYVLSDKGGIFQDIIAFHLPRPSIGANYSWIQLRTQLPRSSTYGESPVAVDESDKTDHQYPFSKHPLGTPYSPFVPSVEDSIIVVSTEILPYDAETGILPDCEGTLIIRRSMFMDWLENKLGSTSVATRAPIYSNHDPEFDDETKAFSSEPGNKSFPSIVPWWLWMEETRWIQRHEIPNQERDVSGMRFAMRVCAPPPIPSSRLSPIDEIHTPGSASTPPFVATTSSLSLQPAGNETQAVPDLQAQATPPAQHIGYYQTRICDFNLRPSLRQPQAVPYPGNVETNLCMDYSQLVETADLGANSSYAPTEAQLYVERITSFFKKRQTGDNKTKLVHGSTTNNQEEHLEWTHRYVREETIILPGVTYAERICTGLPYLEITSRHSSQSKFLMMDTERILEAEMDEVRGLIALDVLLF